MGSFQIADGMKNCVGSHVIVLKNTGFSGMRK